jgi:hypothetical protein
MFNGEQDAINDLVEDEMDDPEVGSGEGKGRESCFFTCKGLDMVRGTSVRLVVMAMGGE